MSYHCNNSNATSIRRTAQSAATKLEHRCFLCDGGELVVPKLTLDGIIKEVESLPVALQILPRLQLLLNDDNSNITILSTSLELTLHWLHS